MFWKSIYIKSIWTDWTINKACIERWTSEDRHRMKCRACYSTAVSPLPAFCSALLQADLVGVLPRPALWPIPLKTQSENKVTAISPAWRWPLANDFAIATLRWLRRATPIHNGVFTGLLSSPIGLTILLPPPSSPWGSAYWQ